MQPKLSWIIFILSSLGLVGCFVYQYFFLFSPGLSSANEVLGLQMRLKSLSWIFAILYATFCFSLMRIKIDRPGPLMFYLICLTSVSLFIGLITFPINSADLYWSLFIGKMSTVHHLDIYSITPQMFKGDLWHHPINWWENSHMLYGPLWVIFVKAVSFPVLLALSAIFAKSFFLLVIIGSLFLIWKIFDLHHLNHDTKVRLFGLFCLNPVLINFGLVDGHNDMFLLFLILASYAFVLQERFYVSIIAIILASFIKYTPIILIIVPLWQIFFEHPLNKKELLRRFAALAIIAVCTFAILWPWIFHSNFLKSVNEGYHAQDSSNTYQYSPGGKLVHDLFGIDASALKLLSFILGGILALIFSIRKKIALAYTVSFGMMFLFASWFQPWYFLWILPIALIAWPQELFIVSTVAMILVTSVLSPTAILLPFGYIICKFFGEKTTLPKTHS